jgi:hypothetical protein
MQPNTTGSQDLVELPRANVAPGTRAAREFGVPAAARNVSKLPANPNIEHLCNAPPVSSPTPEAEHADEFVLVS